MKIIDIPRSGSYADKTSSKNRAGQYVRNRRSPVQPIGTGRRAIIRAAFASASSAWSALTDAQRAAWAGFADGYPYVDSLGQSIKLTGHQMFVAIGTQLLNCGEALPTVPPINTDVPVLSNAEIVISTSAGGSVAVNADSTGAAADFVLVQFSPQMSPGRSFNGRWWQGGVSAGDAVALAAGAAYIAEFGSLQIGKKIFAKLTPVNQYGVSGAPTIVSGIVTA